MTTLKAIAKHVGVSISTVSRVINNDLSRNIHPETKRKVWEAVKELNYKPNQNAINLVTQKKEVMKKTMKIGCLMQYPQLQEKNDPYYSPIFFGISKTLFEHKYQLVFIDSIPESLEESELYHLINPDTMDGIIIIGNIEEKVISFIKNRIHYIVALDITEAKEYGISQVDYDRQSASKEAIKHLVNQGHKKIGFIGGGIKYQSSDLSLEERFIGYKKALNELKLEENNEWIINSKWSPSVSYKEMKQILQLEKKDRPTAMFCASDSMAIAAMRAVIEQHLKIPEDMAFVGIDNIEMSLYSNPPLTTIDIPKFEMGSMAVRVLLNQIDGHMFLPSITYLPYQLIIRESSIINTK